MSAPRPVCLITDIAGDDCGVSDLSDTDSFSANLHAGY
jgi:hypothetical protein